MIGYYSLKVNKKIKIKKNWAFNDLNTEGNKQRCKLKAIGILICCSFVWYSLTIDIRKHSLERAKQITL